MSLADADRVVSAISLDLSLAAVRKLKVRWSRLDRLDVMLGRPARLRHHRLQRLDVVRLSERKALDRLRLAASGARGFGGSALYVAAYSNRKP